MNFEESWTKEKYQEFIEYLKTLSDLKYQEFHSKIIEYEEVLGVKTSELKNIAKRISKGDYKSYIELNNSKFYEPIMIEGLILGYLKIPFDELINYINNYLKKVTNWAHIDLLVTNLRQFKKSPKEGFKYAKSLTHSKNNWAKRCGIVILLTYYLHDIYLAYYDGETEETRGIPGKYPFEFWIGSLSTISSMTLIASGMDLNYQVPPTVLVPIRIFSSSGEDGRASLADTAARVNNGLSALPVFYLPNTIEMEGSGLETDPYRILN